MTKVGVGGPGAQAFQGILVEYHREVGDIKANADSRTEVTIGGI